jgi:translation initiation factor 6 (eIF-6)
MERRKISFLGDLIIIIIIVFFVFLFLNQYNQNNVLKIEKINEKYNVTSNILVPEDSTGYISEISFISQKEITTPLIEFIEVSKQVSEIERQIYRASVIREECISRDLNLKINGIILKIEKLENDFEKINTKEYKKLNIDKYLENLSVLKNKYTTYNFELKDVKVC